MKKSAEDHTFNRRQFLKATGLAGAVAGGAGLGFFGLQAGKDPSSYTGWKTFEGGDQTFNRKRHELDHPPYKKVGPGIRPDARAEVIFSRIGTLMRNWDEAKGIDGLPDYLQLFYKKNPDALQYDLLLRKEIFPKMMKDRKKYGHKFVISNAWSNSMGAVQPEPIKEPPEISDFPQKGSGFMEMGGAPSEPYKFKNPKKSSKLIKKIAHELGATLVGIAKLNPDWVYKYPMRSWRGFEADKPVEVPKHWQYAIAVGIPMSWDAMYANPNYGTSGDAYSIAAIVAFRVASFIKQMGYAARPHTPGTNYDLMVPPILIDSGLGEESRCSVVITPELGSNCRAAVITTNLPLQPDKPISFGVADFCKTCKICAEQCPSGSIPMGGKKEIRGYVKYPFNAPSCFNFWNSNLGNMGCRLCIAVCPYTRKSNWLHKAAFDVSRHDPTGLTHRVLTGLQKIFYPGPDPKKYYIPSMGGENASYRKPPWWLRSEDFIDF